MKTIFLTLFFTCFVSCLTSAQHSIGLNSYYAAKSSLNFGDKQFGVGITLSNQVSNYFQTQLKIIGIFSRESIPAFLSSSPINQYETTPSSAEISYLIRLRPIVHKNKKRITLSTGLAYRYLYRPSRVSSGGLVFSQALDFNKTIGIPISIGAEVDLNKNWTLSLEQENRVFINAIDPFTGEKGFNYWYHGVSLNLVYHLFAKKM